MTKINLAIAFLTGIGLWAQVPEKEVKTFTLAQAEQYAAEHSYSVVDKQFEVDKARQTIRETRAIGLPQISGSFNYSYNAQIQEQPIPAQFVDPNAPSDEFITLPFGVAHQNVAQLQMNQLILDASYFVALRASRVLKETKRLEKETAEIDARKNAAQAYYSVLVAEKSYSILEENLKTTQDNFKETRKLYQNGFVEQQDADQLEILVNNLQASLKNAERQMRLAKQVFKFNLGIPLEQPVQLTQSLEELIFDPSTGQALANENFNSENHIQYRSILSQEKGAQLQVANQKAAYYPKLNGFVRHNQSSFANEFDQAFTLNSDWIPGTTIGASLSWNIFSGLARDARVQTAKIDLDRVQVAKTSTANQLSLNYQQAKSDFNFALDDFNNKKRNMELSQRVYRQTTKKYKEGLSSSLALTQAQNQYLNAESSYINALMSLLNAKENLENALGQ
jgi:outer membrane protein TolC